ncbi:MAG: UDP-N-acetylglucosamine 1-carboxyvinyltransferase [Clostridia bacterium]
MAKLIVTGGTPLSGCCRVGGAKNAVLPILAACVLTGQPVRLLDCPCLTDVENMVRILVTLGCKVQRNGTMLAIDASGANCFEMPEPLSKELRSSIFLLGPVLGRFRRAVVTYPGGCEIGNRPIDLHLKGLRQLGVEIREEGGRIYCNGERLVGADIHLDYPSVGATENIMMAAVSAEGSTVIRNAAREPEIIDLQNFLRAVGYCVRGAGSSTVVVDGGCVPRVAEFTVMPDRIVAGTLLVAGAITGGSLTVENVVAEHMAGMLAKLSESGCSITRSEHSIALVAPKRPRELKLVETLPHPGFPTDMQAQIFALCTVADGTSMIVENVFENRFKHAQELNRMGAVSTVKGCTAVIRGVETLMGAHVTAHDLRGGAALVLAGLRAQGQTVVEDSGHIDRGYERLDEMLINLGAQIKREE